MSLFIDNETKRRVNIYAPYAGFSKLDTPEIRQRAGVIEIADPVPPADYSDETYYRTEQDDAPYVIYTKKSDEQLAQIADSKALAAAKQHLLDTDYAFTVDKYAQLTEERKVELTASREAARQVIRDYEVKYASPLPVQE
jgi:hypothetical protein